ncbi:hypothetical protein MKL09_25120, partial [Methylobacterium sp. J-048]|uniref:hypothetical protein n=1 Tax=Methylobacterium sp. J-048 TaxID=2836635 RepID=UPI001FBB191C
YHAGQISFGLDPGGEYDQGQAALLAKHPDYPALVGQFGQADPGRRGRARLDLYRLARHFHGRAVLFVTHSWGGGIQRHMDDMIDLSKAGVKAMGLVQVVDVPLDAPAPAVGHEQHRSAMGVPGEPVQVGPLPSAPARVGLDELADERRVVRVLGEQGRLALVVLAARVEP